jgi:hypothetical protein
VRLDPSLVGLQQLVYSTFVGGSFAQSISDLAVDPAGVVTIVGDTISADFPTTPGALSTTLNGVQDAFVARLDPSQPPAQQLLYSTFIGGSGPDGASALAITGPGTLVMAGGTGSADYPTTPGAYGTTPNGGNDAFVTHLDLGPTLGFSQSQGPGTPFTIHNGYMIPGNEYYNIFSLDICPSGAGTGPSLYGGLCILSAANYQFVVSQVTTPLGTPPSPFHFTAPGSRVTWGPYSLPPITMDAICVDGTGGTVGSVSPVERIVIQ